MSPTDYEPNQLSQMSQVEKNLNSKVIRGSPSMEVIWANWVCALWTAKGAEEGSSDSERCKCKSPRGIWQQCKLAHRMKLTSRGKGGERAGKEDCGQIKKVLPMRIRSLDFIGQTLSHGNESDISVQSRCKGQRKKAGRRPPSKQFLQPVRSWSSRTALQRGSQEDQ